MGYKTLWAAVQDLEKNGLLVRVPEEISTDLEMAAVHRRVHAMGGPALFFENIRGAGFPAVSNLFGTAERASFLFRKSLPMLRDAFKLRENPLNAFKPRVALNALRLGIHALPRRSWFHRSFDSIPLEQIPITKSWPKDGGNFITLPLVYTEHPDHPGVMRSNVGMYRVQTSGNKFENGSTMGLHYQLHRGIGIHHTAAMRRGIPLRVSIMVGGPPALMLAAVMPLPENISELLFASLLNQKAFRYRRKHGFIQSPQVDFVIHGEVAGGETLPEGPFGDHLGYYSLTHDFPVLRIKGIWGRRKHAIWPFTVVGRPPQEDSEFGRLIHELTRDLISTEIPGVKAVNAVDAAGVHPLLLAQGSERYLPYAVPQPRELLTQANAILGFNQMSLAKYLFIAAEYGEPCPSVSDASAFLRYVLERVDFKRDLHFQTRTTMDTLDYSGTGINEGSKLVIAAYGEKKRQLAAELPAHGISRYNFREAKMALPGVLVVRSSAFRDYKSAEYEMRSLAGSARNFDNLGIMLLVVVDDAEFASRNLENFLWTTFTRSDPARDIYGVGASTEYKHWGCEGALIIDARTKHHHAGALTEDSKVTERIERFFRRNASLGFLERN
jgi:4-hydroxy-3-polyprenylbenzoate decarboxylase